MRLLAFPKFARRQPCVLAKKLGKIVWVFEVEQIGDLRNRVGGIGQVKPFTSAAGRASAVLGSLQMSAGVLASWLVSFLHNGTVVIMPAVMFGCTVVTLSLLFIFLRLTSSQELLKVTIKIK